MSGTGSSIRLRLFLAAGVTLATALALAGWVLVLLFERHVERRVVSELEIDVRQLIAGLEVDADGTPSLERLPGDERYAQLFSGAYWQITADGGIAARSRSLWDEELALPDDTLPGGGRHLHVIAGPQGQDLIAVERPIVTERPSGAYRFRIAAAADRAESIAAVRAFRGDLALALSLLGALLLAAFWIAVGIGLRPLQQLRDTLARLKTGQTRRLVGGFPSEVTPLVDDLNALLDDRDASIAMARARAGDLAHGLKTPLASISVLAEELAEAGRPETGAELSAHVAAMHGHVERQLAQARAVAGQAATTPIALVSVIAPLVRSMRRLPRGPDLAWHVDVDKAVMVRLDPGVLAEALGNLLDNARKWAHSRVEVFARAGGQGLEIAIVDDGPGIPASERGNVLERGKRLDETVPGSGFGLAIAADIFEHLNGRLTLDTVAEPGGSAAAPGLRVSIVFPADVLG